MKILYDHQIFNGQIYGGISRYFYNLINNFYINKDVNFKLSLIYSQNFYLKNSIFIKPLSFLQDKKFKGRDRLLNYFLEINKLNSIYNLKLNKFNIFHPTEYDPYFLAYLDNKPYVLTVYDMIHELFYKENKKYIENKKELILKASKIIAISQNTKKDILKFIDVPEDKIDVTYLASDLNIGLQKKVNLPENYLLFVGNRDGYKNFEIFLKSLLILFKKYENLTLVCVGGAAFTSKELDFIYENNLVKKIFHMYLSDNQLSYAYSHALTVIFPSLYEGFGIP
ncbi:glycosyltransferase family 4 protein, partial [Candidatus Dependentiae bacterium]|nr:glycosyltransferase family 4 protein [Candidatus Dependentiae bacterium]MCG2756446.1 glycosyltransferase family 4 protein [Candidatus Dependentiae bacterium]